MFFLGNDVFHSAQNSIHHTECQNIKKSWVEEDLETCTAGILIKFKDNNDQKKTGFLTKYFGIISDKSTVEPCEKTATFTLPYSTLKRSLNTVTRLLSDATSIPFELPNESFLNDYKAITSGNIYIIFFKDCVLVFLFIMLLLLLLNSKNFIYLVNLIFNKIVSKKVEDTQIEEESNISAEETSIDMLNKKLNDMESQIQCLSGQMNIGLISNEVNKIYLELLDSDSLKVEGIKHILSKKNFEVEKHQLTGLL